MGFWRWIIHMF